MGDGVDYRVLRAELTQIVGAALDILWEMDREDWVAVALARGACWDACKRVAKAQQVADRRLAAGKFT